MPLIIVDLAEFYCSSFSKVAGNGIRLSRFQGTSRAVLHLRWIKYVWDLRGYSLHRWLKDMSIIGTTDLTPSSFLGVSASARKSKVHWDSIHMYKQNYSPFHTPPIQTKKVYKNGAMTMTTVSRQSLMNDCK